jgi:hypothetical protein
MPYAPAEDAHSAVFAAREDSPFQLTLDLALSWMFKKRDSGTLAAATRNLPAAASTTSRIARACKSRKG